MIRILYVIMIFSAVAAVIDKKMLRTVIWLEIFSLISSLCFLWLAAPDVALAEAVVGTLSTIIYIVAVQKYYGLPKKVFGKPIETLRVKPRGSETGSARNAVDEKAAKTTVDEINDAAPRTNTGKAVIIGCLKNHLAAVVFAALLAAVFIMNVPEGGANTLLKDKYVLGFQQDVGGENAITAIYLGYRMYDTVFEALMLLVSVSAVIHLSWHTDKD